MVNHWMQRAVPASHRGRFTHWAHRHHLAMGAAVSAGLKSRNAHIRHEAAFAKVARRIAAQHKKKK